MTEKSYFDSMLGEETKRVNVWKGNGYSKLVLIGTKKVYSHKIYPNGNITHVTRSTLAKGLQS